jgi:hypothetical protein
MKDEADLTQNNLDFDINLQSTSENLSTPSSSKNQSVPVTQNDSDSKKNQKQQI